MRTFTARKPQRGSGRPSLALSRVLWRVFEKVKMDWGAFSGVPLSPGKGAPGSERVYEPMNWDVSLCCGKDRDNQTSSCKNVFCVCDRNLVAAWEI